MGLRSHTSAAALPLVTRGEVLNKRSSDKKRASCCNSSSFGRQSTSNQLVKALLVVQGPPDGTEPSDDSSRCSCAYRYFTLTTMQQLPPAACCQTCLPESWKHIRGRVMFVMQEPPCWGLRCRQSVETASFGATQAPRSVNTCGCGSLHTVMLL